MFYVHKSVMATILLLIVVVSPAFSATTMLEDINVRADRQVPTEESLTIREVMESPARDLGEALESIPGLNSVNKGAIANDIVLRGLQGDDINVFLDGVRLYGGCPSRMDPPSFHFDFAEVEQIKVIKGPYDLENPGSMGGMVNAITKQPQPGPAANLSLTLGSFSLLDSSATASMASETGDLLGGYAYKSSHSPMDGDGKRQLEVYAPGTPHSYIIDLDSDAYKIHTAWIKGGYNFQSNVRSELGYSYQDAENVLYPYLFMDAEYDRTHRVNWTLKADKLDAAVDAVDFQLYWNQVEHLMHDKFRTSSTNPMVAVNNKTYSMQTDSSTSVYGAKAKGDWLIGSGKLTTGIDYYYRNWDATNEALFGTYVPQPMLPDIDVNNFGAFAEYSQPLAHSFKLKGGTRIDYTIAEANALTQARLDSLYVTNVSGSNLKNKNDFTNASGNIQLAWQVIPELELFSGIGLGTRTPDPQELYIGLNRGSMGPSWLGNPNLGSTLNRQIDFGAKITGENFFLNASAFYSALQDYITLTEDIVVSTGNSAKTYQNVDATLWGGELSSQLALPMDFYLRGSLAYVRGENKDKNQPLAETPPLNGSVSVRWDNDSYFAEVTERFAAGQDRVDSDLQEQTTAGWAVTDVKAGANWENWSLAAGVNNIFNIYYFTHLSYQRDPFASGVKVPEVGAFAYATLSYNF
ncbi:TonB-dependent receptor [Geopsychrobacter electrodiphilus]|uniref:TonB-dependent receptor n=1 Tax=Geopsychrobacter electrodiphilus TaxID=225196 RepID=UPI00036BD666|nr:TonB-dependent receptor [Geopsychrobacter electrodiphilus]